MTREPEERTMNEREWRARPSGAMERVPAAPGATVERFGDVTLRVDLDRDGDWVANVTAGLVGGVFIGEDYFGSEQAALRWGRKVARREALEAGPEALTMR